MADDGADMFEDLPEDEGVLLDLPGEAESADARGLRGQFTDLPDDAMEVVVRYLTARESLAMCKSCSTTLLVTTQVALRNFQRTFGAAKVPAYLLTRRQELFKLVERAAGPASEKQRREVFIWAAAFGYEEFVRQQLGAVSDVDTLLRPKHGCPLRAAVLNRKEGMVRLLLAAAARPDRPPKEGQDSLLAAAVRAQESEMAMLLLEANARPLSAAKDDTALGLAVSGRNLDLVRALAEHCSDNDVVHPSSRAALCRAVDSEDAGMVRELAARGIGTAGAMKEDELPPLHRASVKGMAAIVEVLLEHLPNADVHLALPSGKTALYLAAEKGWARVAALLLAAGASLDVQTCSGRSPLFAAVEHGHARAVRALAAVADVHHLLAPTGGGATAISAAEKRGTAVLVPLLECYHRQVRKRAALRQFGDVTDDVSHPYLTALCQKYHGVLFADKAPPSPSGEVSRPSTGTGARPRGRSTVRQAPEGEGARYTRVLDVPRPRSASAMRNTLRQTLDLQPRVQDTRNTWRPAGRTRRPVGRY